MKAYISCELFPNDSGVPTLHLVFSAHQHDHGGVEGVIVQEEGGDKTSISTLDDNTYTFADEMSGKTISLTQVELTNLVCQAMKSKYGWHWCGSILSDARVAYRYEVR